VPLKLFSKSPAEELVSARDTLRPSRLPFGGREVCLWVSNIRGQYVVPIWLANDSMISFLDLDEKLLRLVAPRLRAVFEDPIGLALTYAAKTGTLALSYGDVDVSSLLVAAIHNTEQLAGVRVEELVQAGEEGEGR